MTRFDLTGRVIWVPGGSGWLGSAVSRALAEHGATVIVSATSSAKAAATAEQLAAAGHDVHAVEADITDDAGISAAAAALVSEHGHLDGLVNLAMHSSGRSYDDLTADDWDAAMRVSARALKIPRLVLTDARVPPPSGVPSLEEWTRTGWHKPS